MQTAAPPISRGKQLEAAVDRLPDWYFGGVADRPPAPDSASVWNPAAGYAAVESSLLGSVCETKSMTLEPSDRPQPQDEDELRVAGDPPTSTATVSSTDDELELEKLRFVVASRQFSESAPSSASRPEEQQSRAVRSTSSRRSTTSSSGTYTDLVVSGFSMRGREKKAMYHIDVVDHDALLQTYTIRRSYSDFKELHSQLSEVLDARQLYYRSKAVSRQSRLEREQRGITGAGTPVPGEPLSQEDKLERAIMAFTLPMLPHAGLLSFWKRHDRAHLQSRCESFQELLRTVQQQPFLRESFAMQKFLSVAPCAIRERGSSYVSLCEYSVPNLDRAEEHRERKRRAQQYRRNSSASNNSSFLVEY
ncbi:hypothetical protein BBJ28_00022885 [Nothophytophthora sp. Chile5]|nr:hypothetical protein BBJ28_00022885 [Nothophytophthora sp. Chile5]